MKAIPYLLALCVCLGLLSCGNGDVRKAEKAASACVEAMAADDRDALDDLMTTQMYNEYVTALNMVKSAQGMVDTLRKMGVPGTAQQPQSLSDIELLSVSCDRVEGDTAYVDVETRLGEKSQFETMILKKEDGRWKVAGKQL